MRISSMRNAASGLSGNAADLLAARSSIGSSQAVHKGFLSPRRKRRDKRRRMRSLTIHGCCNRLRRRRGRRHLQAVSMVGLLRSELEIQRIADKRCAIEQLFEKCGSRSSRIPRTSCDSIEIVSMALSIATDHAATWSDWRCAALSPIQCPHIYM
jgi:hypothetical protein